MEVHDGWVDLCDYRNGPFLFEQECNRAVVIVMLSGQMIGWRGLETRLIDTMVAAYSSASCITNLV